MCLKFAKQCLKLDKMKGLFPKNKSFHTMQKRSPEHYKVVKAQTERFGNSAIPTLVLKHYQAKKSFSTWDRCSCIPQTSVVVGWGGKT